MSLKPDRLIEEPSQPNTPMQPGVHLETVCRSLLKIVAHFHETLYTDGSLFGNERRAEVLVHSDPADPASDNDTSQG